MTITEDWNLAIEQENQTIRDEEYSLYKTETINPLSQDEWHKQELKVIELYWESGYATA